MKLLRQGFIIALGVLLASSSCLAFLHTEMQRGRRWYYEPLATNGTQAGGGSETTTRVLAQLRRTLPLSVGLSHTIHNSRAAAWGPEVAAARWTVVSGEAKAWWQGSPRSAAYLRLRYPLSGEVLLSFKNDSPAQALQLRGGELSLGASYRIAPIVSLVFELGQSQDGIEAVEGGYLMRRSSVAYAGVDLSVFL